MDNAASSPPGFWDRFTERQMTLFVILFGVLLYVPFAGSYGLWDPWETHYAEVSRQMTHRGDFISLWWPCSPRDVDVFWSKPVLTYWLQSLGMLALGIGRPGGDPGEMAIGTRAEWAVRMPSCLMGVLGIWGIYLLCRRFAGRRAGVIGAVVVGTSPMYSLIARQAMTDMPYVGPMTMALALALMALYDDKETEFPRKNTGPLRGWLSWPHDPLFYGFLAVFVVTTVPQLIVDSVQLKFDMDIPFIGPRKVLGAMAMIPYYVGFVLAIFLAARSRFRAPLYLGFAAILCGLATLAKTFAPGLALPVIIVLVFLLGTNGWKRAARHQIPFGIVAAVVALVVVAAPWHHAMYIRHGSAWWQEIFGDNNWRRMMLGRHGDRGTFEYFLRELGYSTLPWVALAPAALAAVIMRPPRDERRRALFWFGAVWFVIAYAAVSSSMTKFHHYVLPAVPGIAVVVACFLDDLLERRDVRMAALAAVLGLPLLGFVLYDLVGAKNSAQHFLWLFSYDYIHSPRGRPWPEALNFIPWLVGFGALFAVATAALASRKAQRWGVVGLCGVAVLFTWFLLDVYMRQVAPYWSQKGLLATYYKNRRSPEERLLAYTMYWRGETFYSKNEIYEGPMEERTVFDQDGADEKLQAFVGSHRARRLFFIYERGRQSHLISLLPADARPSFKVLDESNNKFSVAQADL